MSQHLNENWGYDAQLLNFEALYGIEERFELEAREHNNAVAAIVGYVSDQGQTIDVAEWEKADNSMGIDAEFFSGDSLESRYLKDIGNDVIVRDHDGFL